MCAQHKQLSAKDAASVMPLVRFEQINQFRHIIDSNLNIPFGQPWCVKLFKARKLLDLVMPLVWSEYTLHKPGTMNEAMVPFKGCLGFEQYLKECS